MIKEKPGEYRFLINKLLYAIIVFLPFLYGFASLYTFFEQMIVNVFQMLRILTLADRDR